MLFSSLHILFGVCAIGLSIALVALVPERDGVILKSGERIAALLNLSALAWLISSFGNLIATLATLFDRSFFGVLDFTTIRSYIFQTSLGRFQAIEVLAALLIAIFVARVKRTGGALYLLLIANVGIAAPVLQSHSAQSGSHGLAVGSLVIHVIALSWWIGSIGALVALDKNDRELAFSRVSIIALWSSIAVAVSGVVNSWTRLRLSDLWFTKYGALVLAKIALMAIVIIVASRLRKQRRVSYYVPIELALLISIMAIGSYLNRFTPSDLKPTTFDRTRELVGVSMPPQPTLNRLFFAYEADGLMLGFLIFVTALYIRGVLTLSRRGDRWPISRTIFFAIGISLLDYSTSGGLGLYAKFSFQYHMLAHMVLSMIAPIAIVLSAPITLALRSLPIGRIDGERGLRGLLIRALNSRFTKIWTHPVVALAIFDGSLFALYFTPLFGDLMASHLGHLMMNFHFIFAGILFFFVIIGVDPNPRPLHPLARIIVLFAAMSIHAFFSVALMSGKSLIDGGYYQLLQRPWSPDLLADQKAGAALGWAMGEIPILLALIATFVMWSRSDAREARRADKRSESELKEYNDYLRHLAERNDDK